MSQYSGLPAVGMPIDEVQWHRFGTTPTRPSHRMPRPGYYDCDSETFVEDLAAGPAGFRTKWFEEVKAIERAQNLKDKQESKAKARASNQTRSPAGCYPPNYSPITPDHAVPYSPSRIAQSPRYSLHSEQSPSYLDGLSPQYSPGSPMFRNSVDVAMSGTSDSRFPYSSSHYSRSPCPLLSVLEELEGCPCSPEFCTHRGQNRESSVSPENLSSITPRALTDAHISITTEYLSSLPKPNAGEQQATSRRLRAENLRRFAEQYVLQPFRAHEHTNKDYFGLGFNIEDAPTGLSARRFLQPKSQKKKAYRTLRAGLQNTVATLSNFNAFKKPVVQPPTRISAAPSVEIIKVVKKRPAREAFVDLTVHTATDDDVQYIGTKKVRIAGNTADDDVEAWIKPALTKDDSPMSDANDLPPTPPSRICSGDFLNHDALPNPPKGYAGQFDGMIIDAYNKAVFPFEPHHPVQKSDQTRTFGSLAHPNGTFTHLSFEVDPLVNEPEYTISNCGTRHPIFSCINYADEMALAAIRPTTVAMRSRDEETFRREVQLECSAARLEGAAVGY